MSSRTVRLTAGLPAWALRAAVLLAVAAIVILLMAQGVAVLPAGLVALLGLLSAVAPASPAPGLVIVATAVLAAVTAPNPLAIGILALLPLVHVVHIGSALAAVIPGTGRLHPAALRPAATRLLVVQLIVFALAGAAAFVPETVTPAALEIAALLGATALAGLATRLVGQRPK